MKKQGLSIIFIIPMTVVSLLIAGVFGYKLYNETVATRASASEIPKELPKVGVNGKKPNSGYGSVKAPTPTPVPPVSVSEAKTPADFETIIQTTVDDGGKTELDAILLPASTL